MGDHAHCPEEVLETVAPLYAERFGSEIVPDANALRVVTRTVKTRLARIPRAHRHESGKQK